MSFVSRPEGKRKNDEPCNSDAPCKCGGTCTGFASRSDCPPLIVLAVLALNGVAMASSAALAALKAGAR